MSDVAPPTEAQLVELARGGSAEAFQALCKHYEKRIQTRLAHQLKGPILRTVSIADVLQDAYVTAHARLGDFEDRGEGAFGAWLTRIAELKAREAVRRYVAVEKRDVRRELSRGARLDTGRFPGRGPTPSEVAVGKERGEAIHQAVADLPDDYRTILFLVRVEGMTLKHAAEIMDRSHAATKKLYGRALSRLASLVNLDPRDRPHE